LTITSSSKKSLHSVEPSPIHPKKYKHGSPSVIFRIIFKKKTSRLTHPKMWCIRNSSKIQVLFYILIHNFNVYFTETCPYIMICQAITWTCRLQEHGESHELSLETTANHRCKTGWNHI
jgi:hypothetical protein